jgi:hypothetical protein
MQPPKLRGLFRTDPPQFLESQTIEFPIRILIEGSKPLPPGHFECYGDFSTVNPDESLPGRTQNPQSCVVGDEAKTLPF